MLVDKLTVNTACAKGKKREERELQVAGASSETQRSRKGEKSHVASSKAANAFADKTAKEAALGPHGLHILTTQEQTVPITRDGLSDIQAHC